VSRDDGFTVMDVSTDIVNDPKFRRLHRQNPEHLVAGFLAYMATMGESWKAGRRVCATDAWPALLPFDQAVIGSLIAADLLDSKGQLPARAWTGWFGPADTRRKATRERWRRANEKRLAESTNNSAPAARSNGATASLPRGDSDDTGAIPSDPSVPSVVENDSPKSRRAGLRSDHDNPRARGKSPRQTGTNPRAKGTNLRALRDGTPVVDARALSSLGSRLAEWSAAHPTEQVPTPTPEPVDDWAGET
jgi:hypothetical protein